MTHDVISKSVSPGGLLDVLSKTEMNRLLDTSQGGLYDLFRTCALAVLNSPSDLDDGKLLLERFQSFDIRVVPRERGIRLELINAPAHAFVDGKMIQGQREQLAAVVRDLLYADHELRQFDLSSGAHATDAVFHMLRNAGVLIPNQDPALIVCWGGHSISHIEYDYSKEVGYQLGLRGLSICTGCGAGAMKGPMKGAAIGHRKQRSIKGRYVGISEPGIIASESPNPMVSNLVIMPDMEKRLEAFVRCGHGLVVFPGGVGTMEELLYILGLLLHPQNAQMPMPLVLTGPESASAYLEAIDRFIADTLGDEARELYEIIVADPVSVARKMSAGMEEVRAFRDEVDDAYYFNWVLTIDQDFQEPFTPTHEEMRNINLKADQPVSMLAANLRRAFSGIVSGNVKDEGIRAIEEHGLFEISGDPEILSPIDNVLAKFAGENRMKLSVTEYKPCYRLVS